MKKYSRIFILLLVPFLLTACVPLGKKTPAPVIKQEETTQDETQKTSFTGKLKDLLATGNSMKCTAKYSSEGTNMLMVVYTSGEKAYTEMTVTSPEMEDIEQRSIMDRSWIYSWSPETKTGTKMSVASLEEMASDTEDVEESDSETGEYNTESYNQEMSYECDEWPVNQSLFSPPEDVTFTDMTEAIQKMQESVENMDMEGMKESACEACNMLPEGTERVDCLTELGC